MSKIQEVYDGWKNLINPDEDLKPFIEDVSAARMKICLGCEFHSDNVKNKSLLSEVRFDKHCTKCGCTIAAKTRSLLSECPLTPPLWGKAVKE